jgi:D-alanyl-D-alanine carboxypeptidase (penicillin-binding protein 5/6)
MVYSGGDKSYGYLTKDGASRAIAPLVTTENVEKASWFSLTFRSIGGFFSGLWSGTVDTVKGWL